MNIIQNVYISSIKEEETEQYLGELQLALVDPLILFLFSY